MLGHMQPTPFDLRFSLAGIPVRVHPVFWLTAAILIWNTTRERLDFLLIGILCVFVSVLVHELGHAITTRIFGWQPEIVLEFFGGYATTVQHSTWKDIAVLAAGPGAGFGLFFATLLFDWFVFQPGYLTGERLRESVGYAIDILLWANLVWNLVNLVPIIPLDGGQICRELLVWLNRRRGEEFALIISMLIAGGCGLLAAQFWSQNRPIFGLAPGFIAVMFALLCYQNYQSYQNRRHGNW